MKADCELALRPLLGTRMTLLGRAIDVLACSACGGRMRVIAFLEDPQVVRGILLHLGLPADPPPMGRARDPPRQTSFQ